MISESKVIIITIVVNTDGTRVRVKVQNRWDFDVLSAFRFFPPSGFESIGMAKNDRPVHNRRTENEKHDRRSLYGGVFRTIVCRPFCVQNSIEGEKLESWRKRSLRKSFDHFPTLSAFSELSVEVVPRNVRDLNISTPSGYGIFVSKIFPGVLDKHTNRIADPFNTDLVETTGFNNDARKSISRHIVLYEFEKEFQRTLFVHFCRRQDYIETTEMTMEPLMLFSSTHFWEKRFSICLYTKINTYRNILQIEFGL